MNALLDHIIKERKGMYCHCVEVSDKYGLESLAEAIMQEYEDNFEPRIIIEFLDSLEVYCLDDNNEDEVFGFSFKEYINDTLN
jgi:hypothetical protein